MAYALCSRHSCASRALPSPTENTITCLWNARHIAKALPWCFAVWQQRSKRLWRWWRSRSMLQRRQSGLPCQHVLWVRRQRLKGMRLVLIRHSMSSNALLLKQCRLGIPLRSAWRPGASAEGVVMPSFARSWRLRQTMTNEAAPAMRHKTRTVERVVTAMMPPLLDKAAEDGVPPLLVAG